jgi:type IX secretion system PorP/SprF family membrane protein
MDKEAWVGMTSIYGSYSFKPDFGNFKSSLLQNLTGIRFGLNAGMIQKTLDPQWKPRDPGDPRLPGTTSSTTWDLGAGIYYSGNNFWAGISSLHIPGNKVTWTTPGESADYYIARTQYLAGGYNYQLKAGGGKFVLMPSFQIKIDPARTSYAVNAMVLYDKTFWGALNYRAEQLNAFTIMAGLYANKLFKKNGNGEGGLKIGYAYDIATNHPTAFGGTSEIYVGYCFTITVHHEPKVTPIDTRHLGHDPF